MKLENVKKFVEKNNLKIIETDREDFFYFKYKDYPILFSADNPEKIGNINILWKKEINTDMGDNLNLREKVSSIKKASEKIDARIEREKYGMKVLILKRKRKYFSTKNIYSPTDYEMNMEINEYSDFLKEGDLFFVYPNEVEYIRNYYGTKITIIPKERSENCLEIKKETYKWLIKKYDSYILEYSKKGKEYTNGVNVVNKLLDDYRFEFREDI